MIPSLLGILVSLSGLVLIYLGVHGHSTLLPVYPITLQTS
jgi:hypothetical protein